MSGGVPCRCNERREPIAVPAGANRPGRLWRVVDYKCNYSAFNGYHRTGSDYSSVRCIRCGAIWRTTAGYVEALAPIKDAERVMFYGFDCHEVEMAKLGRAPFSWSEASA
jgi:hypothetical protein